MVLLYVNTHMIDFKKERKLEFCAELIMIYPLVANLINLRKNERKVQ